MAPETKFSLEDQGRKDLHLDQSSVFSRLSESLLPHRKLSLDEGIIRRHSREFEPPPLTQKQLEDLEAPTSLVTQEATRKITQDN